MPLDRALRSSKPAAKDTKGDSKGGGGGRKRGRTWTGDGQMDLEEPNEATQSPQASLAIQAGGQEKAKQTATQKKDEEQEQLQVLMKICLQLALRVRELEAACFDTALCESPSKLIEEIETEGRAYAEKATTNELVDDLI